MKMRGVILFLLLTLLVSACATAPDRARRASKFPPPPKPPLSSEQTTAIERSVDLTPGSEAGGGTDRTIAAGKSISGQKGANTYGLLGAPTHGKLTGMVSPDKERQKVVLNFEKADVAEVTNQIFGDYLKLNYVADPTLQGRISVYLEGDYSKDELFQMVTRIYEANNIAIVPRNGIYYVQPVQRSSSSSLPIADAATLHDERGGARPVIIVYRLHYMDATKATNIIKSFLSPGRPSATDALTNSVIFVENTDNAQSILGVLKALDIDVFRELSMEIVPVQSITPQDAAQGMEALVSKLAIFKESSLKNNLAFVPLPNFGGVLILAQDPVVLRNAKSWLTALDIQGKETGEQIYVYFAQNSLAFDIANVLTQAYGLAAPTGGTMGQRVVQSTRGGIAGTTGRTGFGSSRSTSSGLSSSGLSSSGSTGSLSGGSSGFGRGFGSTGTSGSQASGLASFGSSTTQRSGLAGGLLGAEAAGAGLRDRPRSLTGEVVIIPDEVNNALVIRANAADYAKIKKTIETLDILPRAVLIEVTIAEVTLTDALEYGLEYFFQNIGLTIGPKYGTTSGLFTSGTTADSGFKPGNAIIPSLTPGFAQAWVSQDQKIGVLLKLLSSYTDVNVLSTPTLLAVDNKAASIMVGGREPVPTGSYSGSTTGSGVLSTISYEETGIILNLIPHINAGGLVSLDVEQTIRRIGPTRTDIAPDTNAPSFDERNVTTSVLAQSGSTVVLGGIIQTQQDSTHGGVPYLKNVPIIGPLFTSTKSKRMQKTELIIAITPYLIDKRESDLTREFVEKLRNLKARIEK